MAIKSNKSQILSYAICLCFILIFINSPISFNIGNNGQIAFSKGNNSLDTNMISQNPDLLSNKLPAQQQSELTTTIKPTSNPFIKPTSDPSSNRPSTIDPGTATVPGSSYSSREENPKSCVGFYCLYEPTHNTPGAPKFSNDEICRNGIDDNGNGKVDEDPYCTVVPGISGPAPHSNDTLLKPIPSTGPSPFGP